MCQPLAEHLTAVAELASEFVSAYQIPFAEEMAYLAGLYHDMGKYTSLAQKRLRGQLIRPVEHSGAGARHLFNRLEDSPTVSYVLSLLILSHHSGLISMEHWQERMWKANPDEAAANCEVSADDVLAALSKAKEYITTDLYEPNNAAEINLFIRMLFSALVDADFLDTERHFAHAKARQRGVLDLADVEERADFGTYRVNNRIDELRTEMYEQVLSKAHLPISVFELSIPTGGGKTRTGLKFAMEHAKANGLNRVIVAIPFTSIIEQTVEEYRKWLGYDAVLEHHHLADYQESDQTEEEDTKPGINHRLASENWDMPVVVTTHVQFFESLFGYKTSVCRKLHNIADSVVIIDEAQMIPVKYLPVIVPLLRTIKETYRVSFVFCTATQPVLSFYGVETVKLIENPEKYHKEFLRATIERMSRTHSVPTLVDEIVKNKQALVICNKKSTVSAVYEEAIGRGIKNVYVLTTNLYPAHRARVIRNIKERLANNEPCLVFATQLVEAGVHLDFPVVYRELAPLDRIIQAAGRANRDGKYHELGKCFVFQLEGVEPLPEEQRAVGITMELFDSHSAEIRQQSPDVCALYYKKLYAARAAESFRSTEKDIHKAMKEWNHAKVSQLVRFIEDDGSLRSVIVWEASDADAKWEIERVVSEIRETGFATREQRRLLGKYMVQVRGSNLPVEPVLDGMDLLIWRGEYDPVSGVHSD